MDKLFSPDSILVVGVSPSPRNMARHIVHNLIRHGFRGRLYLMGRKPGCVAGQEIYTSFEELPHGIDLAVFLTPAVTVPGLLASCGARGIRRAVVESGGFSELAEDRRGLEEEVLSTAREWGISFVGPNGIGIISRAEGVVLPFMSMPVLPPQGRVSLLAQSGGVGIVYLHALGNENVGLDKFVSMGNKLCLDESDFLDYIARAGTSDVICLYLEDVRRGRKFYESLRSFPGKVVIQKASVSRAGARAARSHTASLSTDDRLVDAAIKQAGALRVEDMGSMIHLAMGLSLPPVKGNRLLILSRSGGHAVIAADLAERSGFVLPELPEEIAGVASASSRAQVIRTANPLDLGDVFDIDGYVTMLQRAVRRDLFDAVALIHVYSADLEGPDSERLCAAAAQLTRETGKPIFLCFLTEDHELRRLKRSQGFPLLRSPEILMKSMAASRNHHATAARLGSDRYPTDLRMDLAALRETVEQAVESLPAGAEQGWMTATQVFDIVGHTGLEAAPFQVVHSPEEAAVAGARLGYPVVMKLLSPAFLHKSRQGGVSLNIRDDNGARAEYVSLVNILREHAPEAPFQGILVQKMIKGMREVFLGGRQDPSFGPVVAVGFGGVYVEELDDITFRLCPVSVGDVEEMLGEVSLFRAFFDKVRQRPADFPYLKECVHRISHLLVHFPELVEIDLNPVKLFDDGQRGTVVDGRIAVRRV